MKIEVKSIDIFCEVIDNFGDIGVVYRLAKELKKKYREKVKIRVILDKTYELSELNKDIKKLETQILDDIEYSTYNYIMNELKEGRLMPSQVIIEAFGCKIPNQYMKLAFSSSSLIINLEYLSCEKWTLDFHGQESFLGSETLKKYFFIPGLLEMTGGVILNKEKKDAKEIFEKYCKNLTEIQLKDKLVGTIFSYEKNFIPLLEELNENDKKVVLLLMGEKTQKSFDYDSEKEKKYPNIEFIKFPFVNQEEYDAILQSVDFNFVRGEDSFVRGAISGVPFLWHAYLQEDKIHLEKVQSFLNCYKEYFNTYHKEKYEKELEILQKLFIDYNDRKNNSLELGKENYRDFYNALTNLREMSKIYREYIMEKCNLIEKFIFFIEDKLK
ncbi:MAG: elongation factor P maturation arginine rhamnosyltransferase EarP [Fusobacteriaceae bacterium]